MTNWHALPLELKTQILGAYVNCLLHDADYECRKQSDSSVLVQHFRKSPPFTLNSPPKSQFEALLLVAPEVQQELFTILDKRLYNAIGLPDVVFSCPWRYSINKQMCILGMLRRQLAGDCGRTMALAPGFLTYCYDVDLCDAWELDVRTVQKQTFEAIKRCGRAARNRKGWRGSPETYEFGFHASWEK